MKNLSYWLLGIADLMVALIIGYVIIFAPQSWEWWVSYGTPAILFMLVINGLFIFLHKFEQSSDESDKKNVR